MNKLIWAAVAGAAAVIAYKVTRQNLRLAEASAHQEDLVDQMLDDSFPASDPPSNTPIASSQLNGKESFWDAAR